jgi:hypothetical protein
MVRPGYIRGEPRNTESRSTRVVNVLRNIVEIVRHRVDSPAVLSVLTGGAPDTLSGGANGRVISHI